MKVISIWQPYASLIIHGHKGIETRGWAAPAALIGTRIGIAATKVIRPEQRAAFNDPAFQEHYAETGLPPLDELPMGCVLGSALLNSCDPMDQEMVEDLTPAEYHFGHYALGRYAWRLRRPQSFGPYPCRGMQGIWEWNEPDDVRACNQNHRSEKGAPSLRGALRAAVG